MVLLVLGGSVDVLYKVVLVVLFFSILHGCAVIEKPLDSQNNLSVEASSKLKKLSLGQGLLDGRKYYYPPMALTLTLPEKWLLKKSDKTLLTVDGSMPTTVIDSVVRSQDNNKIFQLFYLMSSTQKTDSVIDPILAVVVSEGLVKKINQLSNKQLMSIYSFGIKQKLQKDKKILYSFGRESYVQKFSGIEFDVLPTDIEIAGLTVHQDYYSTYANGQVVTFISTYGEQTDRERLERIVESTTFTQNK